MARPPKRVVFEHKMHLGAQDAVQTGYSKRHGLPARAAACGVHSNAMHMARSIIGFPPHAIAHRLLQAAGPRFGSSRILFMKEGQHEKVYRATCGEKKSTAFCCRLSRSRARSRATQCR